MERGRQKKKVSSLETSVVRVGGENGELSKKMRKKLMEQWSPLVTQITPKSNGTIGVVGNSGAQKDKTLGMQEQLVDGKEDSTIWANAQRKLDLPVDLAPKWSTLFAINRMTAKGMNLNYVAPVVKNGENIIKLSKEEVNRATEE